MQTESKMLAAQGKMQNEDQRLQTREKTREKTARNTCTSAFIEVRRNLSKSV